MAFLSHNQTPSYKTHSCTNSDSQQWVSISEKSFGFENSWRLTVPPLTTTEYYCTKAGWCTASGLSGSIKKKKHTHTHTHTHIQDDIIYVTGFPGGSDGKESACNEGDLNSIPGLGRSPGEGNGNPLQYSGLENPMDRGAWQVQSMESQRVRHDWKTNTRTHTLNPCQNHRESVETTIHLGYGHVLSYVATMRKILKQDHIWDQLVKTVAIWVRILEWGRTIKTI